MYADIKLLCSTIEMNSIVHNYISVRKQKKLWEGERYMEILCAICSCFSYKSKTVSKDKVFFIEI